VLKGLLAPYRILILDDKKGPDSWGNLTKLDMQDRGHTAVHVYKIEEALKTINDSYYDLLIIDLDLGGEINGINFQQQIRNLNFNQPILFVTGNQEYLDLPIYRYANAFASGPVLFFDKNSDDFEKVIDQALNRIDPINRTLNIMKKSGLGDTRFTIRGKKYTINDLLIPSENTSDIIRSLKESFQALILEQLVVKED